MAINVELENLYYDDKKERESMDEINLSSDDLRQHDRQRLARVKELLPEIDIDEIWNCHYISFLFQHGESTEDYRTAHKFAKRAVDMGSRVTKWLFAVTLDRKLISQGKLQKFGTQFEKVDGKWRQLPVDNEISDQERIEYGVSPLKDALKAFEEKYSRKS